MRLQEKCKRGAVMVRPRMAYVVQQTHAFSLTYRHANATRFALWEGGRTAHLFHELVDCMCRSFMPFKSWAKTCAQAIR